MSECTCRGSRACDIDTRRASKGQRFFIVHVVLGEGLMGKVRNKRFRRRNRTQPTGLPSVKEPEGKGDSEEIIGDAAHPLVLKVCGLGSICTCIYVRYMPMDVYMYRHDR